MGGSAACRPIRSKTRDGEGRLGVLEESRQATGSSLFQNNRWTKWEAVQLADQLEAKREMVKANWECWKKADKQQEALDLQINGTFFV